MRIIAGEFRGRKLLPPEGLITRPITDRAKQSLFDILTPRISGAIVYDLFAGTGSMGLESLSRGAERVRFFEADRSALGRLKKNIEALGVEDRSQVIAGDLFQGLGRSNQPVHVDLAFLDPPYRFVRERGEDLGTLAEHLAPRLAANGLVIFRHYAKDTLALPGLALANRREYGQMAIELLRRAM